MEKKNYGQFGGLCYPEVVVLCRIAQRNLQTIENEGRLNETQMYLKILKKCLRDVPSKLFDNMDEHIKECDPLENHRKFIRAKNTKVTLFAGQ